MIVIASAVGTALCAVYYLKEHYDYKVRKLPPGPTSIPFIGDVLSINPKSPHLSLIELAKTYGDIFSIKLGSERVVVLNNAELIKSAYRGVDISHRPDLFCMDVLAGGKGFLTCKDEIQRQMHMKICRQAMRVVNNADMGEKILQEANNLVNHFEAQNEKPFDPQCDLHIASLNILCNFVFGERYEHDHPEMREILDFSAEISKLLSPMHPVNAMPWLRHFPNKWFASLFKAKNQRDRILMKKYVEHVVTYKAGRVRDMLDGLLAETTEAVAENNKQAVALLTPEHIIINMWLIFFAGSDTVTNTLQWSLLYMAVFPKKQAKAQEELERIIGQSKRLSLEHKSQLPYLQAVINEVLRYSSLTILGVPHAAARDTEINGYFIPKGTSVMANFWSVHHNEDAWDQPEEFLPERFLNDQGNLKEPSQLPHFMPFSVGKRRCLGANVAKAELFLMLGRLLQEFSFEMPQDVEADLQGEAAVSLIPKPYKIVAKKRHIIQPETI
ncbi:steroid 17-alpha-hydroxylase/17,20 lyase-like [Strongylocentrotus purpuratus]|uniref:Steroid 21-hydroxylase n=1 Tax=Strongylocentrotus purpuratus TaxID=7668 RepID=A0A7M7N2L7_STRPU|nr:steroid 17-alpha-hydroxylase/17,20 lyase-like [Strongylocentrotus purpuratus]XP_030830220.1 steroid 17-alpha-hydroxylase/17,20 lyase-like [Strongylocentrotus purpuratus]